jgi:hypothetical protein
VKAHEPWKTRSDTNLRREALISSFKTNEWSSEFGRWILVEHENTKTKCRKKQVGERSRQMGQQGPQATSLVRSAWPLFVAPGIHVPQIGLSFICKFMIPSS